MATHPKKCPKYGAVVGILAVGGGVGGGVGGAVGGDLVGVGVFVGTPTPFWCFSWTTKRAQ